MLFSKPNSALFLFIICMLSVFPGSAQKVESIYMNELRSGSSVLVITNRPAQDTGAVLYFPNEISRDPDLLLLKALFYQPDSLQVNKITEKEFITNVSEADNDWVLFIHGDSKTFDQAVMRAFDIQHLYKVNVIVYSWPSKDLDLGGVKNFKNSQKNVIESLDHFMASLNFIHSLKQADPEYWKRHNLSCFIHSLGNYYLENMAEHEAETKNSGLFSNLILNAAAVNQDDHPEWLEKINIQSRIYVCSNRQDFNLKGLRIFTKEGKQLGEKVKHPLYASANYIQFTRAVGFRFPTGTTHTYFIGKMADKSMNIRRFYTEILHGEAVDLDDNSLFKKRDDGLGYDIIQ